MMAKYTDTEALRRRMFSYYECVHENAYKGTYNGETLMAYEVVDMIEDCIDNAPIADVVEVVRCGNCRFNDGPLCNRLLDEGKQFIVSCSGFCSWGKKKEDI